MKSWTKPTNDLVEKALASVKQEIDRRYFFSRLNNPRWLQPLVDRDYFKFPPPALELPDGAIRFPFWPELQYLKNICSEVPEEVVCVVLEIPDVCNHGVYQDILDIALNLPGEQSAMLKSKVLQFAQMTPRYSSGSRFQRLLAHWAADQQTSAALELCKALVRFEPDPESSAKRKRRQERPDDWTAVLKPVPRFDEWDYRELLTKGVRPVAERAPYDVASILIEAIAEVIRLRSHRDLDGNNDYSEIWCPRVDRENDPSHRPEAVLVHTLAFACKKVFEESQDSIDLLDQLLRNQRSRVFVRLRQHLYSRYLNEQTRPRIREVMLAHDGYGKWEHPYEFQRMVRRSCEHFGGVLLTQEEWTRIFEAIQGGPSEERYRELLGEEFTNEEFAHRQRRFHRLQLRPFASVLFGEYAAYFHELEEESGNQVSDEDYMPDADVRGGKITARSPLSAENLASLQDEQLITFINEWEDEHRDQDDWLVEITIQALAETFQTVFKDSIVPQPERLQFWIENRERVKRPIYIRTMIQAMGEEIKEKNFSRIHQWLAFCDWILLHRDDKGGEGFWPGDASREDPSWHNSRRAVGDLVASCVREEVDAPHSTREELADLLQTLCTQFDWRLDEGQFRSSESNEPLHEAINSTRSRALEDLVKFGFWLRRHDPEADVSSVTTILEKRFDATTECRLTLPEYAILGRNYVSFLSLDEPWATEHQSGFFPRDSHPEWSEAFGTFLVFARPNLPTFEIFREDYDFALEHISDFEERRIAGQKPRQVLGDHFFRYYLWRVYPLRGEGSLLERYYEQTSDDSKQWAELFNNVGRGLSNSGPHLDTALIDRAIAFFEWRFDVGEPTELREFTFWLRAECLDADWRLDACSKVLDVCRAGGVAIRIWEEVLIELLPTHTAKVVECFTQLTDNQSDVALYLRTEDAKTILRAGFANGDEQVRRHAERAREQLLAKGRFDLFELGD